MSNTKFTNIKLFFFIGDKEAFLQYLFLLVDFSLIFFICIFLYKLSEKEKQLKILQEINADKKEEKKYTPFKILFLTGVFSCISSLLRLFFKYFYFK